MAGVPVNEDGFSVETRDAMPTHFLIKIESFSLLAKRGIDEYESEEFAAGDYKWKLSISTEEKISAELTIADTDSLPAGWEVNAALTFFLYNQISDNYVCFRGKVNRYHVMKRKWELSNLISQETLTDPSNGYLVDDNCVFGAEVFVIKTQQVIEYLSVTEDVEPYKHNFKIENFSQLEDVWESEKFWAGDYEWRVEFYPNGHGSGKGHQISAYLCLVDPTPRTKVNLRYSICIKNQHLGSLSRNCNRRSWFTATESAWGETTFAPLMDFRSPQKGFIVDDCCLLEVEVSVVAIASGVP